MLLPSAAQLALSLSLRPPHLDQNVHHQRRPAPLVNRIGPKLFLTFASSVAFAIHPKLADRVHLVVCLWQEEHCGCEMPPYIFMVDCRNAYSTSRVSHVKSRAGEVFNQSRSNSRLNPKPLETSGNSKRASDSRAATRRNPPCIATHSYARRLGMA